MEKKKEKKETKKARVRSVPIGSDKKKIEHMIKAASQNSGKIKRSVTYRQFVSKPIALT